MNPREAYIALNMMDKVGPVRVQAMSAALGSVERPFFWWVKRRTDCALGGHAAVWTNTKSKPAASEMARVRAWVPVGAAAVAFVPGPFLSNERKSAANRCATVVMPDSFPAMGRSFVMTLAVRRLGVRATAVQTTRLGSICSTDSNFSNDCA